MPYKIVKSGNGYKVQNKNNGKTYSKKAMPKSRAKKQMAAIYANTTDESFENKIDRLLSEDQEYQHVFRRLEPEIRNKASDITQANTGLTREMPTRQNLSPANQRAIKFLSTLYKYTHKKFTTSELKQYGEAKLIKAAVDDMSFTRFLKDNPRLMRRQIVNKIPQAERIEIFYNWMNEQLKEYGNG